MDPKQKVLYHGSSHLIETLEPRPTRVLEGEDAVFATNSKSLAAVFIPKWGDTDLAVGFHRGKLYIIEQYPEALELLRAKNKRGFAGYIYTVSAEGFTSDPRLGMKNAEFIRKAKTKVIDTEIINDVLEYIKNSGEEVYIVTYDELIESLEKNGKLPSK